MEEPLGTDKMSVTFPSGPVVIVTSDVPHLRPGLRARARSGGSRGQAQVNDSILKGRSLRLLLLSDGQE
ncbi:hypothetical protein Ppa06_12920 [Planomonospora parontospora subsp. parontospora]|uniref:Uncharacterized protein n=2 Tax=Planomonospora parontospora TaxID=58119 RepID=A0AA37F337_9ACTN|nr:hypothetical protein GCM10010126_12660 [Planomonospora parontospora]GII07494.1 hypothetical protein Ppa06_12920 [Planomonospora parontospora subsp. parontospora]